MRNVATCLATTLFAGTLLFCSLAQAERTAAPQAAKLIAKRPLQAAVAARRVLRQEKALPPSLKAAPLQVVKSAIAETKRLNKSVGPLSTNSSSWLMLEGNDSVQAASASGRQSVNVFLLSSNLVTKESSSQAHLFSLKQELVRKNSLAPVNGKALDKSWAVNARSVEMVTGESGNQPWNKGPAAIMSSQTRTHASGKQRALKKTALKRADGSWLINTRYFGAQVSTVDGKAQGPVTHAEKYVLHHPDGSKQLLSTEQAVALEPNIAHR